MSQPSPLLKPAPLGFGHSPIIRLAQYFGPPEWGLWAFRHRWLGPDLSGCATACWIDHQDHATDHAYIDRPPAPCAHGRWTVPFQRQLLPTNLGRYQSRCAASNRASWRTSEKLRVFQVAHARRQQPRSPSHLGFGATVPLPAQGGLFPQPDLRPPDW